MRWLRARSRLASTISSREGAETSRPPPGSTLPRPPTTNCRASPRTTLATPLAPAQPYRPFRLPPVSLLPWRTRPRPGPGQPIPPLPATKCTAAVLLATPWGAPGCCPHATELGYRPHPRQLNGGRGRRAARPAAPATGPARASGRRPRLLAGRKPRRRILMVADLALRMGIMTATTAAATSTTLDAATPPALSGTSRRARAAALAGRGFGTTKAGAFPILAGRRSAATAGSLPAPRPRPATSACPSSTTSASPRPTTSARSRSATSALLRAAISGRHPRCRLHLPPTLAPARRLLDCLCRATVVLAATAGKALRVTSAMRSGLGWSEVELTCVSQALLVKTRDNIVGTDQRGQTSKLRCVTSIFTRCAPARRCR